MSNLNKSHQISLTVTSGKIVAADDLTQFFSPQPSSVNGILEMADFYSTENMFLAYVGNTIQRIKYSENKTDFIFEKQNINTHEDSDDDIHIDSRFISVVDYDVLKKRFEKLETLEQFDNYLKQECKIIEVKNGTYKGIIKYSDDNFNHDYTAEIVFIN
jgi:hypothetical protein